MKKLLCISAIALLSGCATMDRETVWAKPGMTAAGFDQDKAQCAYEASLATGSYTPDTSGYRTALIAGLAGSRDIERRQLQVTTMCLKARGYAQVDW